MSSLSALFIDSISSKDVFYFSGQKISTQEPHYYICFKKPSDGVILLCITTTQKDKVVSRIRAIRAPSETIVRLPPTSEDPQSPFPRECYVNCNSIFTYSLDEFKQMYEDGKIQVKECIPQQYYEQIVSGICLSSVVEKHIINELNSI
jgi:hypothetical protein